MRTSNALKNISFSLINKALGLGLTFFVTPVVFKGLGKELYGINALIFQTLGYLGLAELGIGTTAAVALYKTFAEGDAVKTNRILAATNELYRYIGFGVIVIGVVLSFFLDEIFSISPDIQRSAQIAFLFYLLKSAISYFFAVPYIALGAAQKGYKIAWLDIITSPLLLLLNYFVIIAGYDIVGLASAALVLSVITTMFQVYTVKRVLPWIDLSVKDRDFSFVKDVRYVFVDRLLVLGVFQTDFIFISYFLGPSYVANYALYTTFFVLIRDIIWLALTNLSSGVGEMYAKDLYASIFQLWKEIMAIIFYCLIIAMPVVYFVFPQFIELWVGKQALLSNNVLIFFLVNLVYLITSHVSTIFVNARGYFKERMVGSISELVLNVGSSLILIPRLGVLGAIMGTAIGHYSVNGWFIPRLFFKSLNLDLKQYFLIWAKYLMIGSVVFMVLWYVNQVLINHFLQGLSWQMLFLQAGGLFIVSLFTSLILIYLFDPAFKLVLARTQTIIKTIKK